MLTRECLFDFRASNNSQATLPDVSNRLNTFCINSSDLDFEASDVRACAVWCEDESESVGGEWPELQRVESAMDIDDLAVCVER